MTSSPRSTSAAPSRINAWAPRLAGEVTGPGTAMTSRPNSAASRAVISAPLRSAASTTTTPRDSPAMTRFRSGK